MIKLLNIYKHLTYFKMYQIRGRQFLGGSKRHALFPVYLPHSLFGHHRPCWLCSTRTLWIWVYLFSILLFGFLAANVFYKFEVYWMEHNALVFRHKWVYMMSIRSIVIFSRSSDIPWRDWGITKMAWRNCGIPGQDVAIFPREHRVFYHQIYKCR